MQRAEPVDADLSIHLIDELIDRGKVRDVVARRIEMARVEADAEPGVFADAGEVIAPSFLERPSDRAARASRVLDAEPRVGVAALEDLVDRRARALETGLESRAEVRAHVKDHGVRLDVAEAASIVVRSVFTDLS